NSAYAGPEIKKKFDEWAEAQLCSISYERETHRCHQAIADLADSLFPSEPKTISLNKTLTGHDGVFCIAGREVPAYVQRFRPQVLRLDMRTSCQGYGAMNFGESKGMTFD